MRIKYLLVLVSNILIVVTAMTLSVFLYKTQKSALLEGIDNKLFTAARFAEYILPENYHDNIVDEHSVSKDDFDKIVETNNKLCLNLNLQYIWSVMIIDNQIVFTSATSPAKDVRKGDHASFFEVHTNPDAFKDAFNTMKVQYSSFHNKWGHGRMVLVPAYDSKRRPYCFGSSMSISDVNNMVGKTITNSVIISVIVLFVGLILSFILSNFLSKPIIRLTEVAENIASGNLNQKIEIRGFFELINLSKSIETMAKSVNDKIEEVENKNKTLNREIIERKQAEEALRESEEKYRLLIENQTDMIVTFDTEGRLLFVSPSYCTTFDKSEEELLGKKFMPLIYEEDRETVAKAIDNIHKPPYTAYVEERAMTKDGWRWQAWLNTALLNEKNEVDSVIAVGRDINQQKQAEEALRESEEKYRLLTELLPMAIFEIDNQGNITFANKSALQSTGFTQKDIDDGLNMLQAIAPQDHDRVLSMSQQVMQGGLTDGSEYIIQRKDGSMYPAFVNTRPSGSSTPGLIGYIFDLTSIKEAERALRESEEKLARSKKMESMGLLAGGVAHDLNNVLSGIVSYPELILIDLPEDSKFRKPIETMQESGHRAAAIVQDLLTVARGVATTKEPLNLNDLVGDYLNTPEFKKLEQFYPTVTVKTKLDTDLLNVSGSPIHIRKVVMNLVSNASEAIEGSGNVTISTMNRYVDRPIRGYDDVHIGEYAVLSVSDDGSGISSDDLERIFEPFYTKKVMGRSGTGLGLAVVWNVVQDHKGYIDVTTDENGTTFELYFPITRDEIWKKDIPLSVKDYKGNGETILVVDDMETQRDISCKMLDTLGYKTKAVSSGEEAVEYLKENTVDLILLDMIMDPGINGCETYERIIKIHQKQKAVIVSGFAETDEVKEVQKLGAGQYIKKPVTLEKIGLVVKEELEK